MQTFYYFSFSSENGFFPWISWDLDCVGMHILYIWSAIGTFGLGYWKPGYIILVLG